MGLLPYSSRYFHLKSYIFFLSVLLAAEKVAITTIFGVFLGIAMQQ
jgi:hypothetical protein